nr:MAG TPA: hypothetical protein [Inoviridae sp.]
MYVGYKVKELAYFAFTVFCSVGNIVCRFLDLYHIPPH